MTEVCSKYRTLVNNIITKISQLSIKKRILKRERRSFGNEHKNFTQAKENLNKI